MATLRNFKRSLQPITKFDDDGLTDLSDVATFTGNELVPQDHSSEVTTNIVTSVLLDHLCTIYEKNPKKREKLFHTICRQFSKAKVILVPWSAATVGDSKYQLFRKQLLLGFNRMLQAAVLSVSEDMTVASSLSISQNSVARFQQPLGFSSLTGRLSLNPLEMITSSKLTNEFEDIKPLQNGRGGFGKVYSAKKISDGVTYAIKKIKIKSDADIQKIEREVEILSRLSHPNIVRYYDSWKAVELVQSDSDAEEDEDDCSSSQLFDHGAVRNATIQIKLTELLYISMEMCSENLKEWLRKRHEDGLYNRPPREIDNSKSYHILKQILKGIQYLHSKNWFHRDIKPLNIFLVENMDQKGPCVKLGDFGLARNFLSSTTDSRLRRNLKEELTTGLGTAMYAAPEQKTERKNGSGYNEKSDIYSVGLICYELFYSFGTEMEKKEAFDKLLKGDVDPEFTRNCPLEVMYIKWLASKNPDFRPSASEVLEKLRETQTQDATGPAMRVYLERMKLENLELNQQLIEKDMQLIAKEQQLSEKDVQLKELLADKATAQKRISELEALLSQKSLLYYRDSFSSFE